MQNLSTALRSCIQSAWSQANVIFVLIRSIILGNIAYIRTNGFDSEILFILHIDTFSSIKPVE